MSDDAPNLEFGSFGVPPLGGIIVDVQPPKGGTPNQKRAAFAINHTVSV